jgi:hypothetical protein
LISFATPKIEMVAGQLVDVKEFKKMNLPTSTKKITNPTVITETNPAVTMKSSCYLIIFPVRYFWFRYRYGFCPFSIVL